MSARARKAVAAVTHSKRDKPGRKSDKPAAGTVGLKYACTVEIIFMIRIMNTRGFVELVVVLQFLPGKQSLEGLPVRNVSFVASVSVVS
jgi:hypothetical protein